MSNAGRKQKPAAEVSTVTVNPRVTEKDAAAITEMAAMTAEISERYGDGLPYVRERVVHEAKFFMSQSAEAMLEAGKRLIQIKENEPHGEFVQIVEEQLGLNARSARFMMQAAVKYLSPKLAAKRSALTVLGKAKLFDLMLESDDEVLELAEGGTLAGHTLDEFEAMTSRQLRAALKEAKADAEAKKRLIETKNETIDTLSTFKPPAGSVARTTEQLGLQKALHEHCLAVQVGLLQLATVANQVMESFFEQPIALHARECLDYMATEFENLANTHDIQLDMGKRLQPPPWLPPEAAKAVAKHKKS